jgi:23S rRNA pseudouridine1911/1915/1917 synthase
VCKGIGERILFEDNHLIIIYKLTGELVQGDKTGDPCLIDVIKDFIKHRDQKPGNVFLGSPHRLDRPTSGIVIFTKTSKALERMNALFRNKEVDKTYWAIVMQQPPSKSGRLSGWMKKNAKQNKSYVSDHEKPDHKHAILTYSWLASSDRYHLLEVELETGRHHQIRAQLAHMGCVIKGDLKYGAPRSNPDGSISLHARRVRFVHPVSKESIDLEAPVADDSLWNFFEHSLG